MHFSITHLIPGLSREEYEHFFFDENINALLCERLKLERTLVSCEREGANFSRQVEVTMRRQVPQWVTRVVDAQRFVYTETMTYRFGEPPAPARWSIAPNMFSRQVACSGTVIFETHPEGVVRRVEGDVNVRMLGIGTMLERFAIKEIENSFNEAAELTLLWLQENRPKKARQGGS